MTSSATRARGPFSSSSASTPICTLACSSGSCARATRSAITASRTLIPLRSRQQQFRLELNATERLFEARLGRRSLLFRPPYAEDVEPETPDQVEPLVLTSSRGYYTIGIGIDPGDWRNPGVDRIVEGTLDMARNGAGHVVLLHDGGGDRNQTIAALPRVIDGLRSEGFAIVPISTLLGVGRDVVMPNVPEGERASLLVVDAGFLALGAINGVLQILFIVGLVLGCLRLVVLATLAVGERLRRRTMDAGALSVAVIVPAYNEVKVLDRTIRSLLASDGPPFQIIVVDDGSSDGTYARIKELFGEEARVRAFTRPNGGKAAALNFGLRQTDADLVVALDADTLFERQTIPRLAAHFADPRIAAVAGNAKVGNRLNLLTRWQALEYITSQNLDRRAFDLLNCITVVPGAVGAWRRELIVQAGGFSHDTLAEDADLTLSILRNGHHVAYADRAIAWTEAPDTTAALLKQRFRWMYGTLQAAWKQRDTLFRPRFGTLGLVALPNLLLFQVVFPLVSPVMDLELFVSGAAALVQWMQHPQEFSADTFLADAVLLRSVHRRGRAGRGVRVPARAERGLDFARLAAAAAVLVSPADVLRGREVDAHGHPRIRSGMGQAGTEGHGRRQGRELTSFNSSCSCGVPPLPARPTTRSARSRAGRAIS